LRRGRIKVGVLKGRGSRKGRFFPPPPKEGNTGGGG